MADLKTGVYRHYLGGLYRVFGTAHDSTNGPTEGRGLVLYTSLTTGRVHAREISQFKEQVWRPSGAPSTGPARPGDHEVVPRFEFVAEYLEVPFK